MIVVPTWSSGDAAVRPFGAELILIGTVVAVLLTPFFLPRRSNVPCAIVALIGTLAALLSNIGNSASGQYFHGLLLSDSPSIFWTSILLLFVVGVIVLWFGVSMQSMREGDGAEFFTLLLGATLGMCFVASTSNWLMFAISMELTSLPSYVLAGFRKTNRLGAEASLKYVLFGAACNALMIYGISMLYGITGSLQFGNLATAIPSPLLAIGLLGVLIGLGFKIAAVPFHFWCPDVFEGAAIDVGLFLSVASKGAALIALLRIAANLPAGYYAAPIVIGIVGAVTACVGNGGALLQNNMKRLLGYSSIAHAGYIVCAIAAVYARPASEVTPTVLQYLLIYLFMNLGAFSVTAVLGKHHGRAGEALDAFAGLSKRSPILALCMTACLISLIGLPPLAGFNAKLNVMLLLGSAGKGWWTLVAVIGINTVFSMYYYLRIVRTMYFGGSDLPPVRRNLPGMALSAISAIALIALFLAFGIVSRVTGAYGGMLQQGFPQVAAR